MRHPLISTIDLDITGPAHAWEWLLPSLPRWSPRAHAQPRRSITLDVAFGAPAWAERGATHRTLMQLPLVEISVDAGGTLYLTAPRVAAAVREAAIELRYEPSASPRCVQAVFDSLWPLVLPDHGLFHLRAAALEDDEGQGWLLAGEAGCGKSTSTLALATSGWRFAADDAVYVTRGEGGTIAHGWAAPVRITARTAHQFGLERESPMNEIKSGAVLDVGLAARRTDAVRVRHLLFPEVGAATSLQPMSGAEAYRRLLADTPWSACVPAHARAWHEELRTLSTLPAATLVLGPELMDEPERLAMGLAGAAAQAAA